WTPVRVVLAVAALAFVLGMVQKTPCVRDNWSGTQLRYGAMCYSDVPYLYSGRGFAAGFAPYADTHQRYPAMEYPVLIGYFAYGAARVTQILGDPPDLAERALLSDTEIYGAPGVGGETGRYFEVTAVLLAPFLLLTAWFLAGVHRRRPWDAMLFAASPALVLSGLVNWDLLAVTAVAGALWAWSRGRPVLTGVMIGLGTATKLYPVFLLGALLVVCLRRGRLPAFGATLAAAGVSWLVVDLPAMLYGFAQWKVFWTFNDDRGADLGSIWLVWQQAGHAVGPALINRVSLAFFALVCAGVLALGLRARRTPRIPQLAYLIVAGFLLVNKVYSPQYVLWLLPLVVLARPRWRDVLIWTAGEVFYYGSVWLYLGGWTASAASGQQDRFYWLAILVRMAAEVYVAVLVVRDVVQPWHDPVRADGLTDDPAEPTSEPVPV
ncbi:MAG: glycosyltransferase 87 family protein, partial [Nocardioidaceae bacterium]